MPHCRHPQDWCALSMFIRRLISCNEATYDVALRQRAGSRPMTFKPFIKPRAKAHFRPNNRPHPDCAPLPRTCNLHTRLPHTAPFYSSYYHSLLFLSIPRTIFLYIAPFHSRFLFLFCCPAAAPLTFSLSAARQVFVRPYPSHPILSHPISSSFRPLLVLPLPPSPPNPLLEANLNRRSQRNNQLCQCTPRIFMSRTMASSPE